MILGLLVLAMAGGGIAFAGTASAQVTPSPTPDNIPDTPPVSFPVNCHPSFWDVYGRFVCSTESQAQHDTSQLASDLSVLLHIPDPSGDLTFRNLYDQFRLVTDAILGVLIVAGGIMVMMNEITYVEAKQLIPRAILAGIIANETLNFLHYMIVYSNQIITAVLKVNTSSFAASMPNLAVTNTAAYVVLAILILILMIVLLVINLVCWCLLGVIGIYGSLASIFLANEKTEGVGRRWWRVIGLLVINPIAESIALLVLIQVIPQMGGIDGRDILFDMCLKVGSLLVLVGIPLLILKKAFFDSSAHQVVSAVRSAKDKVAGVVG